MRKILSLPSYQKISFPDFLPDDLLKLILSFVMSDKEAQTNLLAQVSRRFHFLFWAVKKTLPDMAARFMERADGTVFILPKQIFHLFPDGGLRHLYGHDSLVSVYHHSSRHLVTGDRSGHIKMYDFELKTSIVLPAPFSREVDVISVTGRQITACAISASARNVAIQWWDMDRYELKGHWEPPALARGVHYLAEKGEIIYKCENMFLTQKEAIFVYTCVSGKVEMLSPSDLRFNGYDREFQQDQSVTLPVRSSAKPELLRQKIDFRKNLKATKDMLNSLAMLKGA